MTSTRIPDTFASPGAVRQHDGTLPVYRLDCGCEVVWATSKRTGKRYPVLVRRGYLDQRFYIGADVHPRDCAERKSAETAEATARQERATRNLSTISLIQEARRAGNLDLASELVEQLEDGA